MLNDGLSTPLLMNGDEIEAVLISWTTLAEHPHRSHPRDLSLLPSADRFERRSAAGGPPRLDLYERHRAPLPDYQIEVMPPEFEAVRLYRPATGDQKRHGDLFATKSEQLTLVFPLGWSG